LARFQPGALGLIARVTGGTPRLINILCDRTLLAAYGHNQFIITGAMVRNSYRELVQQGYHGFSRPRPAWVPATVVGVVLLGLILAGMEPGRRLLAHWRDSGGETPLPAQNGPLPVPAAPTTEDAMADSQPEPLSPSAPPKAQVMAAVETPLPAKAAASPGIEPKAAQPPALPRQAWETYWAQSPDLLSRDDALALVLSRWRTAPRYPPDLGKIDSTYTYFRVASHQNGLNLTHFSAQGNLLATLDLPAILSLNTRPDSVPKFLVLSAMEEGQPILSDGRTLVQATWEHLAPYWRGTVYVPWENYLGYGDVISEESAPETILNLKLHLREIGLRTIDLEPVYDSDTRAQVEALQAAHNLPVDGIVGPLTKMVLYNLDPKWPVPRLSQGPNAEEIQ
jgi:general secretion pathway protein A